MSDEALKKSLVLITLSCGHRIGAMNEPRRSSQKYMCTMGTGCGYSLAWTCWQLKERTDIGAVNDSLQRN